MIISFLSIVKQYEKISFGTKDARAVVKKINITDTGKIAIHRLSLVISLK